MNDLLIILDADIKRCEEVLKNNNYLEIVIAIEELIDKHKNNLGNEISSCDNVWKLSKKDLEKIMNNLRLQRDKLIKDYYNSNAKSQIPDLSDLNFNTEYETERLILKVIDSSEAYKVLDYYLRNKEFLSEFEEIRDSSFYTIEDHQERLNNDLINMMESNSLRLWIYKKEDNKKIIGSIGFTNIIRGPFLSCFLGYKLDKDEVNNGYMTEAVKKGIEIIFNEFKLHRIEANIMPKNKPSLAVVNKLGFENEGIGKKYLKINGKWEDHIHMVLFNEQV